MVGIILCPHPPPTMSSAYPRDWNEAGRSTYRPYIPGGSVALRAKDAAVQGGGERSKNVLRIAPGLSNRLLLLLLRLPSANVLQRWSLINILRRTKKTTEETKQKKGNLCTKATKLPSVPAGASGLTCTPSIYTSTAVLASDRYFVFPVYIAHNTLVMSGPPPLSKIQLISRTLLATYFTTRTRGKMLTRRGQIR